MCLFLTGLSLPAIICTIVSILVNLFDKFTPLHLVVAQLTVLLISTVVILTTFQNYVKQFLDKKDDLTGETDYFRDMIDIEESNANLSVVFRRIMAMFYCIVMCYTVTICCFPILSQAVANHWFAEKNSSLRAMYVPLVFSIFETLGKYSYRWIKFNDNIFVYLYSLGRLILIVGFVLATDKDLSSPFFETIWYGHLIIALLGFTNGNFMAIAYVLSSQRCETKSKKTCGFLMNFGVLGGISYGALICTLCLEDRSQVKLKGDL